MPSFVHLRKANVTLLQSHFSHYLQLLFTRFFQYRVNSSLSNCSLYKLYLCTIRTYESHTALKLIVWLQENYLTMTCGAVANTARVAMMVNTVKKTRHSRSSTIAANFQSASTEAASSSILIFSVITFISLRIRLSSLCRGWQLL